jgi:hypothetical protein
MRTIITDHPSIGEFVAQRAKCNYNHGRDTTIGVADSGPDGVFRVIGGVIYTNYTGVSCWMHMAGAHEKWTTRDFIWMAFDYPFNLMGCARVFGLVEASNTLALSIDLRLGFREVARIPGMFASGDALVLSMERENCRWLSVKPRSIRRLEH